MNKAYPKDPFPVVNIDQLVDATFGHLRMGFLDAFQGYYQIALALEDQEKTFFITPTGNFHYKVVLVEKCRVHISKVGYQNF